MTLEGIGISFGETALLENVTQGIEDYDRIGVLGINGTGKSTLLAIVAGALEPDEGQIIMRNGLKNVVRNISQEQEFWNVRGEAASMLQKLGIPNPAVMPDTLSGGQRKRAALAAALLTPSDLLILDEPTNHLDHEMIEWLQEQLEIYKGALVMITHDRYFLDEVTTTIWEIDRANVYSYPGNYEKYLQEKQTRMNFALSAERKMAALYKQDLAWMMRGARARSTKQPCGTGRRLPRSGMWSSNRSRRGWEIRQSRFAIWPRVMETNVFSVIFPTCSKGTTELGS